MSRRLVKQVLALPLPRVTAQGATLLIYHRVGGGSPDERDIATGAFRQQMAELGRHRVLSLDGALDELDGGSSAASFVITFDDGFGDVYANAWPVLREHGLPFTLYLCSGLVGGTMKWEGSTASAPGSALDWDQIEEMAGSGLCTVANHTAHHVGPDELTEAELDDCSATISRRLGTPVRHFAFTWGIPVPRMDAALRERFRSAATGEVGRNLPDADRHRLHRVPVRGSDPMPFFRAKLAGSLRPERSYQRIVDLAKKAGVRA